MKKIILFILPILICIISCKKTDTETTGSIDVIFKPGVTSDWGSNFLEGKLKIAENEADIYTSSFANYTFYDGSTTDFRIPNITPKTYYYSYIAKINLGSKLDTTKGSINVKAGKVAIIYVYR